VASDSPDIRRMPPEGELSAILDKYLVAPISAEQRAAIARELGELLAGPQLDSERDRFYGNTQVFAGCLFLEQGAVPRMPSVEDLACMLGARLLGMEALRPYCPASIVGAWHDASDAAVRWRFGSDGAFRTDAPAYKAATRWFVVKRGAAGDLLRLREKWGDPKKLVIERATGTDLELVTYGGTARRHVLRRTLARGTREMTLAAELDACACGSRDASALELVGSGTRWFLQGPCPGCGSRRSLAFETAASPLDVQSGPFDLGPGASQQIAPAQFLELYDRTVVPEPAETAASGWTEAVAGLRRARTILHELSKLLPEGAASFAGTTDPRLTRAWIEGERQRLDEVNARYSAERPRIEREERAHAKPRPVGAMTPSTLLAHSRWVSRGRAGEGRLVVEHADLAGRNMGSPCIDFARLVDCDFTGAVFGGLAVFDDAELERVTLVRAHLDAASFVRATIREGDWSEATLSRTNFKGATLAGTDLTRADLSRSVWADAKVVGVRFGAAVLANANLDGAVFEGCDLREAKLAPTSPLPASTCRGARFVDCDLRASDWTGRDTTGATFVGCDLADARGLDVAAAAREALAEPFGVAAELRALLALVRERPPTAEELRAHARRRSGRVTVAGPGLVRPAWASAVGNEADLFVELEPAHGVVGIRVSEDRRGIGTNVELVARRGTLADIEAVVGPTRAMPRMEPKVEHAFADPVVEGHRIVVETAHATGEVERVTVRFPTPAG
jgi:uncharacterized protein YjbI with pentapeptide repeats